MQISNTTVRPPGGPQDEQGMLHASRKRPGGVGWREGVYAKLQHSAHSRSVSGQITCCVIAAARRAMEGVAISWRILAS
ncbi:hypothetical protein P3W53_10885 [Pseudomonas denitrificans (nom. rej.)]|nr:hypothetical protein [Pseudomonas denitrificans (nom. rej.)]